MHPRLALSALLVALWPVLLTLFCPVPVLAGDKAQALRQSNGLVAAAPGELFLSGYFLANEMAPAYLYGPVRSFVASRSCPTAWLMEEGEKARLAADAGGAEYTRYLEEDCGQRVTYYVFVDQSNLTPQQWIDWRQKFHKSKAGPEYGGAKDKLEQAVAVGRRVSGELRFMEVDGQLAAKPMEEILHHDLRFAPVYDVGQGKSLEN